jgi:hypothetical protein
MTMATTTAYSGTIHDSPWATVRERINNIEAAGAVGNEENMFEKRLNDATSSRVGNAAAAATLNEEDGSPETDRSFRMTVTRWTVHTVLWTDCIFGVLWCLYGLALYEDSVEHPSQTLPTLVVSLALIVSTLLLTRFMASCLSVVTAMPDTCDCRRCGLLVSSCIAPVLSLGYATCMCVLAVAGRSGAAAKYLQQHHNLLLPSALTQWLVEDHWIWIVLMVSLVGECVLWQLYREYRRHLLQRDAYDLVHPPPLIRIRRRPYRQRRPWWWQSSFNDDDNNDNGDTLLTRQLLEDNQDGTDANTSRITNTTRWWWFPYSWAFQDNNDVNNNNNARDDGSADFASVQEEWASRTEEDPFWWSRPEDQQGDGNAVNDTSWAKETPDKSIQ